MFKLVLLVLMALDGQPVGVLENHARFESKAACESFMDSKDGEKSKAELSSLLEKLKNDNPSSNPNIKPMCIEDKKAGESI